MNKKNILLALVGLLVLATTVVGTLFIAQRFIFPAPVSSAAPTVSADAHGKAPTSRDNEHGGASSAGGDALYKTIDPAFVVNIQDGARFRFLQVEVDVMARDAKAIANLDKVMPRVKSELTMLFGSLQRENIQTIDGQKALQAQALELINRVLKEETGTAGIAAVYFTKFVVQ